MEEFDDLIMTVQDLQKQGIAYDASTTEFTFRGKVFKKHLSFRKSLLKAGIDYCKTALSREELCFLVLEENAFTIWRSTQPLKPTELHSLSQTNTNLSQTPPPLPISTQLEPEFLDQCQRIMTQYIGSIATQYIQTTLAQFPHLTRRQFVDKLAAYISDPQQAEEFWEQMLTGKAFGQQSSSASSPLPSTENPSPQTSPDPPFKRTYRGISY